MNHIFEEEGRYLHRKRPDHRVKVNRYREHKKTGDVRSGGTLVEEV
jgi:hypothetical protein